MLAALLALGASADELAPDLVRVGPGAWADPFPMEPGAPPVEVPAFLLDRDPVTVGEFRAFVVAEPRWQRDGVSRLFADEGYLAGWAAPDSPGPGLDPSSPVTQVSWFAARAYCAASGGRLPTVAEWELAAAPPDEPEARERARQTILAWYATPTPARLPPVGSGEPNRWGARDLHGLVWEWVEDFNNNLVSADSREQGGADQALFCGAGALGAADPDDYAAFMRVAFRSALTGSTTTRGLGFRCAFDLEVP